MSAELRTDPEREIPKDADGSVNGPTGIYVRAKDSSGKWGSHDIVELERDSLSSWLRSRGGKNEWAEAVVLVLLGHPYPEEE